MPGDLVNISNLHYFNLQPKLHKRQLNICKELTLQIVAKANN